MRNGTAFRAGTLAMALSVLAYAPPPAQALDKMKLAVAQKGSWGNMFAEFAASKGFFEEQGIEVSILYTTGGAETVQALTTGGVDVVSPAATWSVIAAYAKGAPLRIIGSQQYGLADILWYVKADSAIRTAADLNGKKMAYSRPGSVTHMGLSAYLNENKVKAEIISTGNPSATRTMLMTGQIDVGYTVVPVNFEIVRSGEIRVLFSGNDTAEMRDVSRTVIATTARMLAEKRDLLRRYLMAYRKTIDWVYGGNLDAAIKLFAEDNKMDLEVARDVTKYFKRGDQEPAPVKGLDTMVAQAVRYNLLDRPITPEQMRELVDIPYDPGKS